MTWLDNVAGGFWLGIAIILICNGVFFEAGLSFAVAALYLGKEPRDR